MANLRVNAAPEKKQKEKTTDQKRKANLRVRATPEKRQQENDDAQECMKNRVNATPEKRQQENDAVFDNIKQLIPRQHYAHLLLASINVKPPVKLTHFII